MWHFGTWNVRGAHADAVACALDPIRPQMHVVAIQELGGVAGSPPRLQQHGQWLFHIGASPWRSCATAVHCGMSRHVRDFRADHDRIICALSLNTPHGDLQFLSLHVPHTGHAEAMRRELLDQANTISQGARCILGCDANAQMGSLRNTETAGHDRPGILAQS
eukprot:3126884-Amphidinium_carterae.2